MAGLEHRSAVLIPTAEHVAAVIAGIATIGAACDALRAIGWRSSIAGNQITVHDAVFARYIQRDVQQGADGTGSAKASNWVVYGTAERPAVRIVVAQAEDDAASECRGAPSSLPVSIAEPQGR